MTKVLSLRVDDDLALWADAYAKTRGVSRQALLEEGLRSFKDDCERGVPEIRARQVVTVEGVGQCPDRLEGLGHVWSSPQVHPNRPCVHCGKPGRELQQQGARNVGHLAESTAARTRLVGGLRAPMQNGTGDPKKAWPNGMPPEMAARAAAIVEDKRRRDREAS